MACTPAPACKAALSEAMRRWPYRSVASDGICASPRHTRANPGSDHEPHVIVAWVAYATAFDITDDKANGCDADALVEQLRLQRDPRIKYVIAERRMFSSYQTRSYPAWTWRPYTGSNPHSSHVHVSILPEAVHDTRPWFTAAPQEDDLPAPKHTTALVACPTGGFWRLEADGGVHCVDGAPFFGSRFTLAEQHQRFSDGEFFVGLAPIVTAGKVTGYVLCTNQGDAYRLTKKA